MGWTIGVLGFDSRRELAIFLFIIDSRTALGPIQWVPGALSLGVKRLGREADHSSPSSAEIKECVELYLHSPSWRSAQLRKKKHRGNFNTTTWPPTVNYAKVKRKRCHCCSGLNKDLPGLDWLLLCKWKFRKLWHETRDPACKTEVSWVTKIIRRITRRNALERWE
jgi:hypothetical protein